jgi:hypothetical protein
MFVTVLSTPLNLEHWKSTALHKVRFPLPLTGLTFCRITYSAVSLTTVSLYPQQTDIKGNEVCRVAFITYQCLFFLHVSKAQDISNWHIPEFELLRGTKGFSLEASIVKVALMFTAVIRNISCVKHSDTHKNRVALLMTNDVLFLHLPIDVGLNISTHPREST